LNVREVTSVETGYHEVVAHFADRSRGARGELERWRADHHKREVVPYVERAKTRVAYQLRPDDVEDVCRATVHALGEIKRREAESVPEIVNWHPAFAFEHVMHHVTETLGRVPTYQVFRSFCATDRLAAEMLLEPARAQAQLAREAGHGRNIVRAAIQWRVGNAYLSYLREMYVIAVLRSEKMDARYHLLADVLFRVDCWVGTTCLSIYVRNQKFRAGSDGRKPQAQQILGDGPFEFVDLDLARRHEFGTVHLPDRREIAAAASEIMSRSSQRSEPGQGRD
jgi:hypothetical protein